MPHYANYPAGKATSNTITPEPKSIAEELLNSVQQLKYRSERIAHTHNTTQQAIAAHLAKIAKLEADLPRIAADLGSAIQEHCAAKIRVEATIAANPEFNFAV